jgi:TFIIF, beta subunit HTH domain
MECVSRDTNKVMLVRLPESLYENIKNSGEKTGKLVFDTKSNQLSIEISDTSGDQIGLSSRYSAKIEPSDDDLYIFSVDGARKANMKAKIAFRGNLLPERSSILEKQSQESIRKISEYSINTCDPKLDNKNQKRVLKLHEDHKSFVMANAEQAVQATLRKKYKEKRVRGDPEKVKAMLFELFSHQRYWKTKALADETSQPESFLNEMLQELGDKVPSGQYRGHWQLKSQYREPDDPDEPDLIKKSRLV